MKSLKAAHERLSFSGEYLARPGYDSSETGVRLSSQAKIVYARPTVIRMSEKGRIAPALS
jgi:hypothetical protein